MVLQKSQPTNLPTSYGHFQLISYQDALGDHLALLKGPIKKTPLVRIHSQCITGDALRSLRCDCGEQLDQSLKIIAKGGGILIYLQQEGRGIGLFNKIRAYYHQDKGLDTVEANKELGFKDDLRNYATAAQILIDLGITSISLLSNNPRKKKGLETAGIKVLETVPLIVQPNQNNAHYLKTKQEKLGHSLS